MDQLIVWSPGVTLEQIEKIVILKAFQFYRGNKTSTANALGIAIRTLDNKLEKYELDGKQGTADDLERKRKQNEWLIKQRGVAPQYFDNGASPTPHVYSASSGLRVESTPQSAPKPSVPVSQRKEVQSVLPTQNAKGNPRGSSK